MKVAIVITFLLKSCAFAMNFSSRARNFSVEILQHTQQETSGHVVISPLGIWSVLTTVAAGADGRSQKQLKRALRLPKSDSRVVKGYKKLNKQVFDLQSTDVSLNTYNFIFVHERFPLNINFVERIESDFDVKIINLNFEDPNSAAEAANEYVKQKTHSMTTNAFRADDFTQSKFIISNGINFKGLWTHTFNESETTLETFYDENKNKLGKVNMMYQKSEIPFSKIKALQSTVVELSYGTDNKYCMLLILPDMNVKVSEAYKRLEEVSLDEIFEKLQKDIDDFGLEEVEVMLPRFRIATNVVLNKPLMSMGIYDIFDEGLANFKPITDENVFVSAVIHTANIEVTEAGTTASSWTNGVFTNRMSTLKFEANRPFIYFVMEKPTATIVFGGIYSQPTLF